MRCDALFDCNANVRVNGGGVGSGGALRVAFKQGKDLWALRDSLPGFFLIRVLGVVAALPFEELSLESKEASSLL